MSKAVSRNFGFDYRARNHVDGFVYALAQLGLAEYEWVNEAYVLRRQALTT